MWKHLRDLLNGQVLARRGNFSDKPLREHR